MSATATTDHLHAPADVTAETRISTVVETITCTRCGGSGNFGPMSVMAGRCFKCGGSGTVATKRGAAARAFYRQLVRTPAGVLQPGDRVYMDGIAGIQRGGWTTVEEVVDVTAEPERAGSCSLLRVSDVEKIEAAAERGATILPYEHALDGEAAVRVYEGLSVRCVQRNGEGYTFGARADKTVLAAVDTAVKVAILKTVAEYQSTLTKAGKPRKGTRWAA